MFQSLLSWIMVFETDVLDLPATIGVFQSLLSWIMVFESGAAKEVAAKQSFNPC